MPYIPPQVTDDDLARKVSASLGPPRRGKVRDTYQLPGHTDKLFAVASDRISIFDFVLGALVKDKGAVLTAMTVLWLTQVFPQIKNHLLAWGKEIDNFLPPGLHGDPDLQSRALVVKSLKMVPVECIVRAYLTGSGWTAYRETGQVCGITLPLGLHDGSELPSAIFTPTTKAEEGHDEHLDTAGVLEQYGQNLQSASITAFCHGQRHAANRGILLADTKFEFGQDGCNEYILADEVLTPDSSRFWLATDHATASAQKKSPAGYDKQPVREYGKTVTTPFTDSSGKQIIGIQNLKPAVPEHRKFVGQVKIPAEVTESTSERYRTAFKMLADIPLDWFQFRQMGIEH